MDNGKLKDPVDKLKPKQEQVAIKKAEKIFDITKMSINEFKSIPREAARSPHPFQGYPKRIVTMPTADGRPLKDGSTSIKVNLTHLVAINPTKMQVHQDPSGLNQVQTDPRTGEEKRTTIKTTHNRIVVDYENGGINIDVDFGRELKLEDGSTLMCAIVSSHSARAQLCFQYNPKAQRIEEDDRYVLPDVDQVRPLRRVFEMIINPRIKTERWAASISGESNEDLDELAVAAPLPDAEG